MGSGGESLIKSEKKSTNSRFEINMERFGSSWFSVTHPQDPYFAYLDLLLHLILNLIVYMLSTKGCPNFIYFSLYFLISI
jgi:hypothetical protein